MSRVRRTKLALDISEAQHLYLEWSTLHSCLTASVGLGAKPQIIWGGTTTPPHIDEFCRFYQHVSIIYFFK